MRFWTNESYSIFNFRRQTFYYQIWYFHVAFQTGPPTRSLSNNGLLSEKYCSTIADLPRGENKPQLKSPSLVAFEYEPLDFHYYKIHPCLQSCSKRFYGEKAVAGPILHEADISFRSHKCITKVFAFSPKML